MTDTVNPTETRTFPLGLVLSITTGTLLHPGGFGDVHEAVEWFVGEPVLTVGLTVAMPLVAIRVLEQHPQLADIDTSGITRENWAIKLAQWREAYGDSFTCTRGEKIAPPPDAAERIGAMYDKIGSARHGQ
jgi:hypothetical protein